MRGIPREERKKKRAQMTEWGYVGRHDRARTDIRSENKDRTGAELTAGWRERQVKIKVVA